MSLSTTAGVPHQAGGLLLPHEEEGPGRTQFFLGWCGGPPGWARLFVSLHRATHDAVWLDRLALAARAVAALVQPPTLPVLYPLPPAGTPPWSNLGQCCGASAAAQFLLSLADGQAAPLDPAVRREARAAGLRLARAIAARGVPAAPDGPAEPIARAASRTIAGDFSGPLCRRGLAVPSPEEHAAPLDTRWQAGWMQGAAGVGSLLLHAHALATGQTEGRRVPWPDEPYSGVGTVLPA